ncbi:MAG TPA: hypothetical protein VF520_00955 [Thermoleophilaceae bacterium]
MTTTTARLPREREETPAAARPELTLLVTRREDDEPVPAARVPEPQRRPVADPQRRPVADPQRRTVVITGQRPEPRRRPATVDRVGPRPDRIAMWAFLLGLFLVVVATATADAAPL